MALSGMAVAMIGVGGVVMYSGITGASLADTFQSVLKGKNPSDTEPIAFGSASGSPAGNPSASPGGIVSDAQKYEGDRYVWGGSPGTTVGTDNGTDCSGFVNMVVGRDLGMAVPGYAAGKYSGASHGPATGEWLLWGGAKTVPRNQAQPGDLAVWQTHMGIITDNGQNMISALSTNEGVKSTTISGGAPPGEVLFVRRIGG